MQLAMAVLLLLLPALANGSAQSPATAACRSSVYPKLCRAIIAPFRSVSPAEYGRFSVRQALKHARRTATILDRYLARANHVDNGALEDCRQLATLSSEYLEAVQAELGPTGRDAVSPVGADRVRALMSAVVTNQETCFDGLEAASRWFRTPAELYGSFSNDSRVYGVSLELVTAGLDGRRRGRTWPDSVEVNESSKWLGSEHDSWAPGRHLLEGDGHSLPLNQSVTVAGDGTGNFTTIGDAVAFAPNDTSVSDGYFAIFVGEGVYQENIVVTKNKKNLILVGAGMDRTVITSNRSVVDGWSTYNSATFAVHGERFIAINISFENNAGPEKHQAVAVRNSADLSSFYLCRFLGYQDTLYAHSLRQFYRDCDIYGTVDFIFGNAASVFQNCRILARKPLPNQFNAITAQGRTHPDQTTGISIHNCTVRAAPDLMLDPNSTRTFLGRPWKEYSRTVYMQSFIDDLVEPVGWQSWNETFGLSTLFYGEFANYGPGANTSQRVQWPGYRLMDATQASNFTVDNFTTGDAWLPSTSIPYSSGLL